MFGVSLCIFISSCFSCGAVGYRVFHFTKTPHQVIHNRFNMCFAEDKDNCFEIDRARFEFYTRTTAVIHSNNEANLNATDDETGLRSTVDSILYNMMDHLEENDDLECIPFVSTYTDCTKDNICTGCQKCTCDEKASWNCTLTQKCLPDIELVINKEMIQNAIENLRVLNAISRRVKRQTDNKNTDMEVDYNNLVSWMYNTNKLLEYQIRSAKTSTLPAPLEFKTETTTLEPFSENINPEAGSYYLAFDEILNFITADQNDTRPKDMGLKSEENDMLSDVINEKNKKLEDEEFIHTLNVLEELDNATNAAVADPTEAILDLLDPTRTNSTARNKNRTKREIAKNETMEAKQKPEHPGFKKLKEDVLYPITAVINNKQKEIDELLKIRKKIIRFLMKYKNFNLVAMDNVTEPTESPYLSIYKIGVASHPEFKLKNNLKGLDNNNSHENQTHDLNQTITKGITEDEKYNSDYENLMKNENLSDNYEAYIKGIYANYDPNFHMKHRSGLNHIPTPNVNTSLLDKYLFKVKQDIYEVVKDVVRIQRYSNSPKLPKDLRVLIRAMRYYVRNQDNMPEILEDDGSNDHLPKKQNKNSKKHDKNISLEVKPFLVNILTVVKDSPKKNAINYLSSDAYRIVQRLIKHNYLNEFDTRFNVSLNYLNNVGSSWLSTLDDISDSKDCEKLYKMKLMHIILMSDVEKIQHEIKVVKFAQNRRMHLENTENSVITKIKSSLQVFRHKLDNLVDASKEVTMVTLPDTITDEKSYMNKMKKMLKDSKQTIIKWIRKSINPSIDVQGVKRRYRKPNEKRDLYSTALQRWLSKKRAQSPQIQAKKRHKRATKDAKNANQMGYILPKYLRAKVYPAAMNARNNRTKVALKRTKAPKNGRHARHKSRKRHSHRARTSKSSQGPKKLRKSGGKHQRKTSEKPKKQSTSSNLNGRSWQKFHKTK